MIDLRAARNDPDAYRAALARKGAAESFDELLAADREWLELTPQVDALRARTKLKGKPTPEQLEELRGVKVELQELEQRLDEADQRRQALLDRVPNPPAEDTPDGATEEDAVVVKLVGEPPVFSFEPRDHLELAAAHGWIDVERAARVSGSRFVYRVGDVALLEIALYRWAMARIVQKGHVPMLPPVLVRDEAMYGTGFFPSEKGDFYEVPEDGLYLVGTSEVPLAAFHMGEEVEGLPLRYVALSTCFRREAGAAGRDTRGMFRVHQFDKVEMFVFCEPERSRDEHERLLAIEEELVQELELPYRVLNIAAGDLGSSAAKKYDIEAWFPGQSRYREITSTSNTTDYQARRLNVRFRRDGKLEHVHTLNGTAVTARAMIAILENFQHEDGSVSVPEPLGEFGAPARLGAAETSPASRADPSVGPEIDLGRLPDRLVETDGSDVDAAARVVGPERRLDVVDATSVETKRAGAAAQADVGGDDVLQSVDVRAKTLERRRRLEGEDGSRSGSRRADHREEPDIGAGVDTGVPGVDQLRHELQLGRLVAPVVDGEIEPYGLVELEPRIADHHLRGFDRLDASRHSPDPPPCRQPGQAIPVRDAMGERRRSGESRNC